MREQAVQGQGLKLYLLSWVDAVDSSGRRGLDPLRQAACQHPGMRWADSIICASSPSCLAIRDLLVSSSHLNVTPLTMPELDMPISPFFTANENLMREGSLLDLMALSGSTEAVASLQEQLWTVVRRLDPVGMPPIILGDLDITRIVVAPGLMCALLLLHFLHSPHSSRGHKNLLDPRTVETSFVSRPLPHGTLLLFSADHGRVDRPETSIEIWPLA